jgi:hypothetical protein
LLLSGSEEHIECGFDRWSVVTVATSSLWGFCKIHKNIALKCEFGWMNGVGEVVI